MSAFKNGADGVMLLACHEGNCHSGKSATCWPKQRAAHLGDMFAHMGFESERLTVYTLAANMGVELAEPCRQCFCRRPFARWVQAV
jgi:quinone-modifying oxidoreductase subunit QmoB